MKKTLTTAALLLFFLSAIAFAWLKTSHEMKKTSTTHARKKEIDHSALSIKLQTKAGEAKVFISKANYNPAFCFLIDMSLPSGEDRFFVYDFSNDSILLQGLVAHGSCDRGFQLSPTFSNKKDCGCSSIGKYKIGGSYKGRFGLSYKLYGLDSSNSNAFERSIVLHGYDCVPEQTDHSPICNSRGCPMVAPGFLQKLKPMITTSKKPILLWIFE